jgi:hypothetical protein
MELGSSNSKVQAVMFFTASRLGLGGEPSFFVADFKVLLEQRKEDKEDGAED